MLVPILFATCSIMLASLVGVVFVWKRFGVWVERHLSYLVSFSTGVFAVVIYGLGSEAFGMGVRIPALVGWAVLGVCMLELGSRVFPQKHHHHELAHDHPHSRIDARRVLIGDALHNIGDGIFLVPAFFISVWVGITTTAAIFLHELVQELSEFFILREAGYSTKKALWLNLLVSSTICIGVAISLFVSVYAEPFIGPLIALTAGGFLYVVIRDLLPNTLRSIQRQHSVVGHVAAIVLGLGVMLSVSFFI